MRLRKVVARRAFTLVQMRDGIEPQPIDALVQPEAHHLEHRLPDVRIVEVQVGLVVKEAVPVVGAGASGSHVQFDVSASLKITRACAYRSVVSLQT